MSTLRSVKDFETTEHPTWCSGCGDFGIWMALKQSLIAMNYQPHQLVIVFGIGCNSNGANWIKAYGFHGLHGRALPLAVGVKLANHRLPVIIVGGDGDGYGEGLNHFIQTIKMNPDITYIVHNNQLYSLTKGQASPTTEHGQVTDSTPFGSTDQPLNPLALALAANCGYVARGFAGDVKHLQQLITGGLQHHGFSYIDVLQPCVTFNHLNTYAWFYQRVVKLETTDHDPQDKLAAWKQATSIDTSLAKVPIGVFYTADKQTYEDQLPMLKNQPLVQQSISDIDISPLLKSYQ